MTRTYTQTQRLTMAAETRRRILDAAQENLRRAPFRPFSVEQVARSASVARSTVYLVFGSRSGLFEALATDLLQRGGMDKVLAAAGEPDARESLRGVLDGCVRMFAANSDALRAIEAMVVLDDEVGEAHRRLEASRAGGMAKLADRLAADGVLRDRVTDRDAADLLLLLSSFQTFDLLHRRHGDVDAVADTVIATAERSLCR